MSVVQLTWSLACAGDNGKHPMSNVCRQALTLSPTGGSWVLGQSLVKVI